MFTKNLILLISLGFFIGNASLAQDFKYVGAAKCKMCHISTKRGQQYKKWQESKHANAMKILNAEQAKDPKCTKCHSTALSVDKKLITTLTVEEGVSCESCHGPGSAYMNMNVMKDQKLCLKNGLIIPDEKTCIKCHNQESPNYKGFDFKKYKEIIAHPAPPKEE